MQCAILRLEGAKGSDRVAGEYSAVAVLVKSVRVPAAEERGHSVELFAEPSKFLIFWSFVYFGGKKLMLFYFKRCYFILFVELVS